MTLQGQWWSESDSYVSDILSVCSLDSDRSVLHWRGQVISGAELNRSVFEIFHSLRDNGVRKGDVVAVLVAPNSRVIACSGSVRVDHVRQRADSVRR